MNPPSSDMDKQILEAIREGQVSMRGRWYFRTRHLLLAGLLIILALLLIWHSSFEWYALNHSGRLYLLTMGWVGWRIFFLNFPWWWAGLGLVIIIFCLWLLRHQTKMYRWPLFTGLAAMIVLVLGIGLVVFATPLQDFMHRNIVDHNIFIPGLSALEKRADREAAETSVGVVTGMTPTGLMIIERNQDRENVIVDDQTTYHGGAVLIGDAVIILGQEKDGQIRAREIRKLPPQYRKQALWAIDNIES